MPLNNIYGISKRYSWMTCVSTQKKEPNTLIIWLRYLCNAEFIAYALIQTSVSLWLGRANPRSHIVQTWYIHRHGQDKGHHRASNTKKSMRCTGIYGSLLLLPKVHIHVCQNSPTTVWTSHGIHLDRRLWNELQKLEA